MMAPLKNLSRDEKKRVVVSRSKKFFANMFWIMWGIPLGWTLCHYFVDFYGGDYPEVSMMQFTFDMLNNIGTLAKVLGFGSIPAIITLIVSLYKKRK